MAPLRSRPRAAAIAAGLVVVALAASTVAGRGADVGSYRTAVVSEQQVDQVLRSVGSIEPVTQAAVAFPVAGTVSGVDVAVGDQVTVGQSLASLDAGDLTTSLHAAEANLASAELSLELALAGEDPGATVAGAPAGAGTFGRAISTDANATLRAAQEGVLEAQQAVDAAMGAAEAALANAATVCAAPVAAPTTTTEVPDDQTEAATDSAVCQQALAGALEAQRQLAAAQQRLADASVELTALLEELAADEPSEPAAPTTEPKAPSAGGRGSGGGPTVGSGSPGGAPTGTGTDAPSAGAATSSPTAEELIAYQKAVDAAVLEVAVAEHAIDQSTIVSSIAGTVVAVGMGPGDSVTAGSATQTIVIVGDGGFEVTTSISVADLPDVAVGQGAVVVPDGPSEAIEGEVVRIGVAPESSGSGATYALTIGLDGDTSSLGNGSVASVAIVTESSGAGLAVPTSAVTASGDRTTVERVVDGEATETEVEIGPIGDRWIAIADGLSAGDTVVIADLDEPLPGSATEASSTSGSTATSGFPGGGVPGGFRPGG